MFEISLRNYKKMFILRWLFLVLTVFSVRGSKRSYNIIDDDNRNWNAVEQTITVEGLCFPEHCGTGVADFEELTIKLNLIDDDGDTVGEPKVGYRSAVSKLCVTISHTHFTI